MAEFQKAARVSEVPPNSLRPVQVGGADICLVNLDGEFYALSDVCSHAHCSLADGDIENGSVVCPCHGGAFDIKTGQVTMSPPMVGVAVFEVKVEGEDILVASE